MKRISMQPLIPIVISFIISESILLYYEWKEYLDMGVAQWVTIIVALVGVAGGIWMQLIQLKKDVQKMEDIKEKCIGLRTGHRDLSAEHKELSAEHKELSAEHKDLRREHKDLSNKIDIKTEKLDEKLTDIIMVQKTEKARREEASKHIPDATRFIKESQGMFDTIYTLNKSMDELKQENNQLKVENALLKRENDRLNSKSIKQELSNIDRSIDETMAQERLNGKDISQDTDEPDRSR